MSLQWLSVDLLTQEFICDLPTLESRDPFRRTLGRYESNTAVLNITAADEDGPGIDPSWERGVLEGGAACIAYTGDPGSEVIAWGGIVMQAPRTLGSTVQLSLATPEVYLAGRYCGAYKKTAYDQNQVVVDLVTQFASDALGMPITVVVVGGPGPLIDYTVNAYDDKTVYSALTELMGRKGGPEWTMHWQWDHSGTKQKIRPVLYVGTRIGAAVNAGMQPNVTFDSSNLDSATVGHDWTAGNGANIVTAVGTGQGLARAVAPAQASDFRGRPAWEYRYTPTTNIFDTLSLQGHANQARDVLQNGSQPITLVAPNDRAGLQLGVDWNIGDDIGYDLVSPSMPRGVRGVARCIGYEATDTTTTPILWSPGVIQ